MTKQAILELGFKNVIKEPFCEQNANQIILDYLDF